jgi:ADP-L-glycero-D-manno-heptose 6-epimerase
MTEKLTALVTGATGFVGSNLTSELVMQGYDVIAIGRKGEQDISGLFSEKSSRSRLHYCSFHRIRWEYMPKFDILFHQAAIADTRVMDKKLMNRINVTESRKLFGNAVNHGCKRIVYASSTAVYGRSPAPHVECRSEAPIRPYDKSKFFLDEIAMDFAAKHPEVCVVGLRYCNVFGPGENHKGPMASMVYHLARQMQIKNPEIFRGGEQKRDWIYVDDAVRANICAATNAKRSCVVNCGTGKAITFNEIVAALNRTLRLNRKTKYIDMPERVARTFQTHTECNMEKAGELIGFFPEISFEEGVRRYHQSGKLLAKPITPPTYQFQSP